MITFYIDAVGLAGPGLKSWSEGKPVLRGETPYRFGPLERYRPALLPANERRRASTLVRMVFRVCEEIFGEDPAAAQALPSVFASSGGDYYIVDRICRVLRDSGLGVSPTQFHNSVHNAPAGYWSIASSSTGASTSLSAYDCSFASGLVEAAAMVGIEREPLLMVVCDTDLPQPLVQKRPIEFPFAVAFVLAPEKSDASLAALTVDMGAAAGESVCRTPELEPVRQGNPAARTLPLLELLATGEHGTIVLPFFGDRCVNVEVTGP